MSISACFTNYNRVELLYEAVKPFLHDDRIREIVILDDYSQVDLYNLMVAQFNGREKVKIHRNAANVDCYHAKALAIKHATSEYVLILDSDNVFSKEYIDRIENLEVAGLNPRTVYQPEFARPHFNFTRLSGVNLTRGNIAQWISMGNTETMLNAFNYMVNRAEYLKVFDPNIKPVTSDSIYHNYRWLNAGNSIYVVPGLQYDHRVDNHGKEEKSHYIVNNKRTQAGFHDDIINRLRAMK